MEQEDTLLLQQIQEGSILAYEQLFKKYYKPLVLQARFLLNEEMEAEDLVQNLFVKMWQKNIFTFVNSSIKAYLQRAVRNECLHVLEKKKVHERKMLQYFASLEKPIENDTLEARETQVQIENVLKDLPMQRLTAFKLVYFEKKKYQEAANEMGISINSIKTHLKLAIKSLQQKMIHIK
ncbi:sigma-70 family RNA polymerase sigma factor [Olivibacter sp. SDN3]|uniref:RNA polymerase sigma factor n=1 Tax=Olivibacter sp. SDN3 TaxID=2764720 RepID=UPI0016514FF9|nr:sigma-70 family RNA polymerase sigma factor [Olivibacter sp. SDN3]QNL51008.1 sigma-70 family RNA polymerase sigma factor [Olivibacter sp. SDN3]